MNDETTQHWSKSIVEEAIETRGSTQITCGGWSPSGIFHVGNAREIATCNGINKMLKIKKTESRFIFIIDDTDPLDKIPKIFKKYSNVLKPYLGHPINKTPDPTGETDSYAEHFTSGIVKASKDWGIDVEFIRASELYNSGKYDKYLKLYLQKEEEVQQVIERISGSRLDGFFSVVCGNCGNAKTTKIQDSSNLEEIHYECKTDRMYKGCDFEGSMNYKEHLWKLKWRLDWPARQAFLGVTIEPAGKDHAADGGSIDTTFAIHKEIFGHEPPLMPGYGFIVMRGKKMSGSKDGIPAADLVNFMDPYAFLFMIYRANRKKDIEFKIETAEYGDLIDEFIQVRRAINGKEFNGTTREYEKLKTACELALPRDQWGIIPANVKFSELVLLYQTNFRDRVKLIETLERMEKLDSLDSKEELNARISIINYWLDYLAPESVKFKILDKPPENIKEFWSEEICATWTEVLTATPADAVGKEFLNYLREIVKKKNQDIKQIFEAFYQLLLGKRVGPNAAGLIESIGRESLLEKIRLLC